MNALVIYDSQYGNTERIAQSIADTLRAFGEARAVRIGPESATELRGADTVIFGSPTQGWKHTKAMQAFLQDISAERLHGVAVACFDTRFHKSRWLTGSAAVAMAKQLQKLGIRLLVPPESFFVDSTEGPLESGELDRASTWARLLASTVEIPHPTAPA